MSESEMPLEVIEAQVTGGSDYPSVYRLGSRVRIERDAKTGQLIITRGSGALRVASVTGAEAAAMLERIDRGLSITGQIVGVETATDAKIIRIQLDRATEL